MTFASVLRPAPAKSPADAAALERFERRIGFPLVLAAILPLFLLPGENHPGLAAAVVTASWMVFLVDFVVHQRRVEHYLRTWIGRFDLSVVLLTAPWFLLVPGATGKFVLLIRVVRVLRLLLPERGARRLLERLGGVTIAAAVVVVAGAGAAYSAEHGHNPEFETMGDALWWSISTLTTVGYGDVAPITTGGRVIGAMVMITGLAVLGLLAGSLASFFRIDALAATKEPQAPQPEIASQVAAMRAEIAELTAVVASLKSEQPATREVGTRP